MTFTLSRALKELEMVDLLAQVSKQPVVLCLLFVKEVTCPLNTNQAYMCIIYYVFALSEYYEPLAGHAHISNISSCFLK